MVEVADHLTMVAEVLAESPSMTARGIDVKGTTVASLLHGRIVGNGIGDGRHGSIVVTRENQGRRSDAFADSLVAGELADKNSVGARITQEAVDRAFVGNAFVHRDDRIKKNGEVGTCLFWRMGADG